jgi:MFS family permease
MNSRNIKLGYAIMALNSAFFWYATWLLYVYKYIDVGQVAILQLIALITRVSTEIPTGAICDLLGKRKTLILAFLLGGIGEIIMSQSTTFLMFGITYVLMGLGQSLCSGTIDAFMYDSLVEKDQIDDYPKVLARSNAFTNVATAIATISGGFLFSVSQGLPFLLTGLMKIFALLLVFFTTEPVVDTFAFSFRNFVSQTTKGLRQLFGKNLIRDTIWLLILGGFSTVGYEILDDASVVDWGYSAIGISILYTSLILLSIPSGFFYQKISKLISSRGIIKIAIIIFALNFVLAPWINVWVWTGLFLFRVLYSPIRDSATKEMLNRGVESNIRATTISTYELLKRVPFMLFGIPIGSLMKSLGVRNFSSVFAISLLTLFILYLVFENFLRRDEDHRLNLE